MKNMEKYILDGQAMLMSVKVGQKFIMDRIREFGGYDSCPDAMSIDPETELPTASLTWTTRWNRPTGARKRRTG